MTHKIITPIVEIPYNVNGKSGISHKFVAVAYDDTGAKRLDVFKIAPDVVLPPVNTFCVLYFDQFTRVSKFEVISPHGKGVNN